MIEQNLGPATKRSHFKINSSLKLDRFKKTQLKFIIEGPIDQINFPQQSNSPIKKNHLSNRDREIGLWEKTCFEFFIGAQDQEEYWEFNFNGYNKWNCFYLNHYRSEIKEEMKIEVVHCQYFKREDALHIQFMFELPFLRNLSEKKKLTYNISAVLKTQSQKNVELWALKHQEAVPPDFHNKKNWCTPIFLPAS